MAPAVLLEYTREKDLKKQRAGDLTFTAMLGKSQKFSRSHCSGFVPDYRHAVETVDETEGFGSSDRADSEDSSEPKRKVMNLNMDRSSCFNIPSQVISVSKMSRNEKKEMQAKLRSELEQMKVFQRRVDSKVVPIANAVAVSSSSDGYKKKAPHSGSNLKRSASGRFESSKKTPHPCSLTNAYSGLMKSCTNLLDHLMKHKYGWVFNTPVDVVKLKIPDYFSVIKHPMDLGTVKNRLTLGAYSSPLDFVADVRLTFTNAMTYNPPGNDVHIMADTMRKFFETRWKPIQKKLAASDSAAKKEAEAAQNQVAPPEKKRRVSPLNSGVLMPETVKLKVTEEEKQNLSRRLESLLGDIPDHIIDFLRRHSDNGQSSEDEIEIDIDSLSDDTFLELRRLLDDYLREKKIEQAKVEPCEIEIVNDSGVSNSLLHRSKVYEPADEDVDIGGNDLPISSYPPLEIEKDTAVRNIKVSSSSSSSSDSSSSSGSDSASSSGSESDVGGSSPANISKENVIPDANQDQERSDVMNPPETINAASVTSNQAEEGASGMSVPVEADGHQEGENAPSERQVSPEKQYRAALLKSRFADTILKAREKALDQGERGDPEKLRLEKEELERRRREERVRLQAEAKAAEEARKQAEAEVMAEAKRKRELEREAARQALLKMEKTVDINENSLILKDLEMLRTVSAEHMLSSVDETSPDLSEDGMGAFNLGGSNPLEQLGLYMKVDDEEDDEGDPAGVPTTKDIEEGEID